MDLSRHLAELVAAYRETESCGRRGPAFKAVALAIETQMSIGGLTKSTIISCFGPPDLFDDDVFVYRFDHEQPGRNLDEWFFSFEGERLTGSGYNECGINDVSGLRDGSEFPAEP